MTKKKKNEIYWRKYISIFFIVFLIILILTFIDFLIHSLSKEYAVPDYYFRNKIIFGTIIGLIIYFLVKNKNPLIKSLTFSVVVSVLLQIRYFLEGYPIRFVIEFLAIHFIILFIVSIITFKYLKRLI
ncbi:MAG: hypothetical protein WC584_00870 [Candidatus Pacearchaeota archaeon]